mmetsp:Transcript_31161/g.61431  ORF Transcript_31161/g.61431 Transcript_31161/m.61431 type:complete len:80 (+) Transcript_31161:1582-1821(+)
MFLSIQGSKKEANKRPTPRTICGFAAVRLDRWPRASFCQCKLRREEGESGSQTKLTEYLMSLPADLRELPIRHLQQSRS